MFLCKGCESSRDAFNIYQKTERINKNFCSYLFKLFPATVIPVFVPPTLGFCCFMMFGFPGPHFRRLPLTTKYFFYFVKFFKRLKLYFQDFYQWRRSASVYIVTRSSTCGLYNIYSSVFSLLFMFHRVVYVFRSNDRRHR